MTAPSSRPDAPAQQHADTVRVAIEAAFYPGEADPYESVKRPAIDALDALLKEVERLTAERDAALHRAEGWVQHDTEAYAAQSMRALKRAEAAERERDEARRELAEERERNPSRVICPRCQANLPCESCRQYSLAREEWERRAEAAEALAERRGEALRQIKPLVTGDLPPLTPLPMTMRCVGIADIVDAALADGGDGDGAAT